MTKVTIDKEEEYEKKNLRFQEQRLKGMREKGRRNEEKNRGRKIKEELRFEEEL